MALVGECRGWDLETVMLHEWRKHTRPVPQPPSQSRFNRRRRNLMAAFNVVRQAVLHTYKSRGTPTVSSIACRYR